MAKGDKKKVENTVQQQVGQAQPGVQQLQRETSGRTGAFEQNYGPATGQQLADYSRMMGGYQDFQSRLPQSGGFLSNFLKSGVGASVAPFNASAAGNDYGALGPAVAGYGNMAQTGGFSPEDISNIRARSIAPIRGIYDAAQRNVARAKALNPGLTNTGASQAKLAREQSYGAADAATNAEAGIADSIRSGKLAGLGGLSNIGLGTLGQTLSAALQGRGQDLSAILGASGQELGAMGGQTSLYGTTPALSELFGRQVLGSSGQQLSSQEMQNQLAQIIMSGQLGAANTPSTFQNILSNIGKIKDIGWG